MSIQTKFHFIPILLLAFAHSAMGVDLFGTGADDLLFGGGGNDQIAGFGGDDLIQGSGGMDKIFGGSGDDLINAGSENDLVCGGIGDDDISAGSGNDLVSGGAGEELMQGEGGDDILSGGGSDDQIRGGTGNDILSGGTGGDSLFGDSGNDMLSGDSGDDIIDGGADDDMISGGGGNDIIGGGTGDDTISGDDGGDNINGEAGNDAISGGDGDDIISGGDGNDILLGGRGNDNLSGEADNDTISGGEGDDNISGDGGNDLISAGNGADIITGGFGDDQISGGSGADNITGGFGNDRISGGSGANFISGGSGNDRISAGNGADIINGGTGNDQIFAGSGANTIDGSLDDDTIEAGAGNDIIGGSGGDDIINGGEGNDLISGGTGNDDFVFCVLNSSNTVTTIIDFNVVQDRLIFAGTAVPPSVTVTDDGADITVVILATGATLVLEGIGTGSITSYADLDAAITINLQLSCAPLLGPVDIPVINETVEVAPIDIDSLVVCTPIVACPPDVTIECGESANPSATGTPRATDEAGATPPTIFLSDSITAGSCPQELILSRRWSAIDTNGYGADCIQLITVVDSTSPVITCPANVTVECDSDTSPVGTGSAAASDNCSTTISITFTDSSAAGTCADEETISRTWMATDECGNSAVCTQSILLVDATAPVITCPANITVECDESTSPTNTLSATATDNCSTNIRFTYTDSRVAGTCVAEETINRTWMATDACGNSAVCTQTIVVVDTTAPVITCPVDITVECNGSTAVADTGSATATDNCVTTIMIASVDMSTAGTCTAEFVISRAWTATDECGNSAVCTQTITVADTTSPVITCPANVTVECTESTEVADTGSATATDNCATNITIASADTSTAGTCTDESVISRAWTATDECGNSAVCTQTITIVDTTAPMITCPADITVDCEDSIAPADTGLATATDNCSPTATITYTDNSSAGSCSDEEVISRTWMATDGCGNSAVCTQTVTVVDDMAPMISCPIGPLDAVLVDGLSELIDNTSLVSVLDNCSTNITLTQNPATGTVISNSTVVTITATDPCGNAASCSVTNRPLGEVSGVVWLDVNRDQNTDEHLFYLGLSRTLVSLIEVPCEGEVNTNLPMIVQTLMTGLEPNVVVEGVLRGAARGFYAFLGVPFGCYEVEVDETSIPLAQNSVPHETMVNLFKWLHPRKKK